MPIQIHDRDGLRSPERIGVGILDDSDTAGWPVATVVDDFPRDVRVTAHAPEQPRRGLPDRHPLVPAQEVQPAQEDHQRDQRAGQYAGDHGAQQGATG